MSSRACTRSLGLMRSLVLAVVMSSAVTGCAPRDGGITASNEPSGSTLPAPLDRQANAAVETMASALSRVLADQGSREIVSVALRESNLTEHKLRFRDFINATESSGVKRALADELGMSVGALDQELRTLPDLDFYMLAKAHRQSWTPDAPVLVAAQMGNAPSGRAYDALGRVVPLRLAEHKLPSVALLFLQEAEPVEELSVSRVAASKVIEHPLETWRRGKQLAHQECDPEEDPNQCEGGNGGGGSEYCTDYRLKQIVTVDLVDNGNPFETNEIEVHGDDGTVLDYARVTGVEPDDVVNVDLSIICSFDDVIFATKETDGTSGDDNFAPPFPNTSKWFNLVDGVSKQLYSWPSGLDPLYYPWKVAVKMEI